MQLRYGFETVNADLPFTMGLEDYDEFTQFDKNHRPIFPGYTFEGGKSVYRDEEVGEGGYVYSEPGMYSNIALLDIASMHPSSIVAEELFGPEYTKRFNEILQARIAIKHKDFDKAKKMLGGALAKYLTDENAAADLAQALKIAINSVYGLTSAGFENPFRDNRNKDNIVANRYRAWDVWRDFVTMFACSLSNPLDKEHRDKREALYLEIIKKYNKQEQEVFPELAAQTVLALEEDPEQDFLGSIFMSLNLGNEHNGQIFTPYHVCKLMAEVTMDNTVQKVEQDGYISINDPCCGAGATLIAAIHAARKQLEKTNLNYQNHLLVVAQDIDETVALMCYIQLSLLGVAGYVKVGNSLTEPMTDNDDKENYWFTPMYFSNVWVLRRIFGGR